MKWTTRTEVWITILLFVVLSVAVFYISFTVEQNSLSISLFGLFFVLFMGLLATTLDRRIKSKNYPLFVRTIVNLVLINMFLFVILILVFRQNVSNFITLTITYTLGYSLFTFIRYKLDSE